MHKPKIGPLWQVALALLGLTLLMFGDVLFSPRPLVLSKQGEDLFYYFVGARGFGFGQLRQGHLALWNPHVFSGTPFFGNFQSALLYPPNWTYLLLPLDKAIDCDIALHLLVAGLGTSLWAARRGLHPLACLVAGTLAMFGGPYFLKVYAGHLTALCAMAWTPLVFLALDGMWEEATRRGAVRWWLLGVGAVAMQALAGHPQTVFNTGVAAIVYTALLLVGGGQRRRLAAGVVGMYAGGAALAAVQILTGLQVAAETTRSGGVPYEFAAMFSLPPENLLTLLAPGLFGDLTHCPYWGRWYLWEMSLFMGVSGLSLAAYGALCGGAARRWSPGMVALLLLLALAAYTPLFGLLYAVVPGFDHFRGHSKFIVQAGFFLALLAGIGCDNLLREARHTRTLRWLAALALALGVIAVGLGLCIQSSAAVGAAGPWGRLMTDMAATNESYVRLAQAQDPQFIQQAGRGAAQAWLCCGATCLLLGGLWWLRQTTIRAAYGMAGLALLEVFVFARATRPTFDLAAARQPAVRQFLAEHPGDYRILQLNNLYSDPHNEAQYLWGYDPVALRRYAEFMAWTQGQNPDNAADEVIFRSAPPLYRMLRLGYVFTPDGAVGQAAAPPLPRLQLVRRWTLAQGRDHIFALLGDPAFDPRRQVILETPPVPEPVQTSQRGAVRLVQATTDALEVEAILPQPAILLVTDAYSTGWRAVALPGSVQRQYQLLPADYVLRAVPLDAGHHYLRLEYAPSGFRIGRWISLVSLAVYLSLFIWHMTHAKRRRVPERMPCDDTTSSPCCRPS